MQAARRMFRGEIAIHGQALGPGPGLRQGLGPGLRQGQHLAQGQREESVDGSIDTHDNVDDTANTGSVSRVGPGSGGTATAEPGKIVPVPWCVEILPGPLFRYQSMLSIHAINIPVQPNQRIDASYQ